MTRQSLSLLLILVTILSCGKGEEKEINKERIVEVRTAEVRFTDYPLTYRTNGYLEAVELVEVKPLISGRVKDIYVEEGDRVREGDTLLKIEDGEYEALYRETLWNLEQARREYENSRAIFERRKALYEKELISREEFETAKTKMESLEARIKSLQALVEKRKIDLDRTNVRSPIDGYIVKRLVNVGDVVGPNSVCYEVVKLDPLRFVFRVPQEIASHIKIGSKVELNVGGERIRSKIAYISPSADRERMFTAKAFVENREGSLKPSMYGEVSFRYGKVKAVLVPENAIQLSRRHTFLWVIRDSRAVKVPVRIVGHSDGLSAVVGELKEGDRIAVENLMFLKEGVRVRER